MRRKLTAVVIAVSVFGLISASAASLTVNSSELGAGVDLTASCDTDGVDVVSWATSYSAADNEFRVTGYTVDNIAAACNGDAIQVDLLDGSDASLDNASGTISGTSFAVTGIDVSAAAVEGVAVVISG